MYDVEVENHGTLHLVKACDEHVEAWLEAHTAVDAIWWGRVLVVEPRYTVDLLLGLREAGFNVPLERKDA